MAVVKQDGVIFDWEELDSLLKDAQVERQVMQEVLEWSPETLRTPEGTIRIFFLPAMRMIAVEVIPVNPENSLELQCRRILQQAFQNGLFDEFLVTLRIYKRLRPVILYFAERFAKLECMNVSLSLSHIAGGDGYAL